MRTAPALLNSLSLRRTVELSPNSKSLLCRRLSRRSPRFFTCTCSRAARWWLHEPPASPTPARPDSHLIRLSASHLRSLSGHRSARSLGPSATATAARPATAAAATAALLFWRHVLPGTVAAQLRPQPLATGAANAGHLPDQQSPSVPLCPAGPQSAQLSATHSLGAASGATAQRTQHHPYRVERPTVFLATEGELRVA